MTGHRSRAIPSVGPADREAGSTNQTLRALLKAWRDEPVAAFVALARRWLDRGQTDAAEEVLVQGLALAPGHMAGAVLLGRLLAETGRTEDARRRVGELLARFPDHHDGLWLLAGLERKCGHVEAEKSVLERLRRLGGDEAAAERLADLEMEPSERPRMPRPHVGRLPSVTAPSSPPPEGTPEDEQSQRDTVPVGPGLPDVRATKVPEADRRGVPADPPASAGPRPAAGAGADGADAADAAPNPGGVSPADEEPFGERQPLPEPFVNATMAELMAAQGDTAGALSTYRQLVVREPGRRSFRQRYVELGGAAGDLPPIPGPEPDASADMERAMRDLAGRS